MGSPSESRANKFIFKAMPNPGKKRCRVLSARAMRARIAKENDVTKQLVEQLRSSQRKGKIIEVLIDVLTRHSSNEGEEGDVPVENLLESIKWKTEEALEYLEGLQRAGAIAILLKKRMRENRQTATLVSLAFKYTLGLGNKKYSETARALTEVLERLDLPAVTGLVPEVRVRFKADIGAEIQKLQDSTNEQERPGHSARQQKRRKITPATPLGQDK